MQREFVTYPPAAEVADAVVGNQHFVQMLDRTHAEQVFASAEQREALFRGWSFREFERHALWMNGVQCNVQQRARGYGPPGVRNIQCDQVESPDFGRTLANIKCQGIADDYRQQLWVEVFEAAQDTEDFTTALALAGLAGHAVHPLPNGNTRFAAQGFSLFNRGYDGSPEDKAYYARRRSFRLDPIAAGLGKLFAVAETRQILAMSDYKGPPISGVLHAPYDLIRLGAERLVSSFGAGITAVNICEKDFNLLSLTGFLVQNDWDIRPYVKQMEPGVFFLGANSILSDMTSESEYMSLDQVQVDSKVQFVRRIITWLRDGNQHMFGNPQVFMDDLRQKVAADEHVSSWQDVA